MKKLPSFLQLYQSVRKQFPPPSTKHKNKKQYNRKKKHNEDHD